jgi:hypothetical protein
MATTAVVAGTAGAVHHHQEQKYANQAAQQQAQIDAQVQQQMAEQQYAQQQYAQPQYAPPPQQYAPPPAAPAGTDVSAQLAQLGQLYSQGILSADEFAAAKAKLLG